MLASVSSACSASARPAQSRPGHCVSACHQRRGHLVAAAHAALQPQRTCRPSGLLRSHASAAQSGPERGHMQRCRAGAMDVMPTWTLDQIAGLAFGAIMLLSIVGAKQVDVWVARQQRKQLGLCEQCGGVYEAPTCQQNNCPAKQP